MCYDGEIKNATTRLEYGGVRKLMVNLGGKLAKIARKGALDASKSYFKMSVDGNLWNQGIEPYICTKIGEQIFRSTGMPIELEYPYVRILERFNNGKFYKSHHVVLTPKSKFDIVIFRKNNKKPIAVVEIKKRFSEFKIEVDRERVLDAVFNFHDDGAGVRFGIVIAVEAIRANQQKTPEIKINEALDILNRDKSDYQAEIDYDEIYCPLGKTRNKKTEIIGARAYSIVVH